MRADILMGFRDVALAMVTRDDSSAYACLDAVALPAAVRLRRSWMEMSRVTYSDEGIRERVRAESGIEAELRLAGINPVLLAELGLWVKDEAACVYREGLPRGGRGYSLRFVADSADGVEYCCKYRMFWVENVRMDEFVTRGFGSSGNTGANECVITGILRAPMCGRVQWWETLRLEAGEDEQTRQGFLMGGE
ncbi:hypothetical protein AGMMS49992_05260 [Clostridia bacterium]|nr:hypothetical protein AGMMS49992_05260 [Clostridia bacterium]